MISLAENINESYIEHDSSSDENLVLYEKNDSGNLKDKPYSGIFKKSRRDKDYLVLKNINELSSKLFYSKNTPSDCDYILINLEKKEIYYIEFKASNGFTKKSVEKQILAGHKWLEHFCFCSDVDLTILSEFKKYNIWWEYDKRMCRSIEPFCLSDSDIIKVQGNIFCVSKIRHYMRNRIN